MDTNYNWNKVNHPRLLSQLLSSSFASSASSYASDGDREDMKPSEMVILPLDASQHMRGKHLWPFRTFHNWGKSKSQYQTAPWMQILTRMSLLPLNHPVVKSLEIYRCPPPPRPEMPPLPNEEGLRKGIFKHHQETILKRIQIFFPLNWFQLLAFCQNLVTSTEPWLDDVGCI